MSVAQSGESFSCCISYELEVTRVDLLVGRHNILGIFCS